MKKRYLLTLALSLAVGGAALIVGGITGNQLFADQVGVVATNSATITSFLVFGGAMLVMSIIFFIILARL